MGEAKPSPPARLETPHNFSNSLKLPEEKDLISANMAPLPPRWGRAFPVHLGANCHHICLDLNRLPGLFFGRLKKVSKRKSQVSPIYSLEIVKAATDVYKSREAALKLFSLQDAPYAELSPSRSSSASASSWEDDVWTKDVEGVEGVEGAEGAEDPVLQDNRAKTPSSES